MNYMITILNLGMLYLVGMMIYAILTGNILYWGGWQHRIQNKGMYYGGLFSYGIVLYTLNLIKSLEETRLLQ
jgi:hypothetical protein